MTDRKAQPSSPHPATAADGSPLPLSYESKATVAAPLGDQAAWGIAWMVLQTLGSKAIAIVGQVLLAWFLGRQDFGQVGLAYAIAGFASILQQSGLREILVQRHRHFQRWENAAFWMSLVGGLLSAAFMLAAAPAAAAMFDSPRLTGLLAVLALTGPISALAVVPTARLQVDLRFRLLSVLALLSSTTTVLLSVFFAWLGFGAYSFILPMPIVASLRTITLLAAQPPRVRPRLQLRRWRHLLGDSGLAVVTVVCIAVSLQGDYLILGYRHGDEQVGLYFFAFNLSSQTMQLLASNIAGVMFPTLSRLQFEPDRQREAFVRASRLAAALGVPLCFLQAAAAAPLFTLLFDPKWQASVPIFQVLSLGMAGLSASIAAGSMMQAQGRFKLLFHVSLAFAIVFVAAVSIASWLGAALAVAVAVTAYHLVTGPFNVYFALRPVGGGWKHVWQVYAVPFFAGALAVGVPYLIVSYALVPHPSARAWHWARLALTCLSAVALYLPLVWLLMPAEWAEFLARARAFFHGRVTAR